MKRFPLHPLLAAAYGVLVLLAHNIAQVKISDALRPLALVLVAAMTLWGILYLWLRDSRRAGIAVTLLLALAFSYGRVYQFFENIPSWRLLGRHRTLLPLWLILAFLVVYWAARLLKDPAVVNQALNVILIVALGFPVVQIGVFTARTANAAAATLGDLPGVLHLPEDVPPPDVYYIVLDAYTRADYLEQVFEQDNRDFIEGLRELGFYVAHCSQSNYAQTELALVSTLNYAYLDELGLPLDPASNDRAALYPLLRHSSVRRSLESLGYTTVAFDSDFYRTQIDDADVYLSSRTEGLGGVTGFEVLLMRTSAGLALSDAADLLPGLLGPNVEDRNLEQHRKAVRYSLHTLPELPKRVAGPKFVFVHILAPHDPYVFGPQGEPVSYPDGLSEKDQVQGYRDQVIFLNSQILPALKAIIETSDRPPVIILQGDHGAGWSSMPGRMAILNAYYLPGRQAGEWLYPIITPVNSFRIIFDAYFGTNMGRLEDRSYFSTYPEPFKFEEVSQDAGDCQP